MNITYTTNKQNIINSKLLKDIVSVLKPIKTSYNKQYGVVPPIELSFYTDKGLNPGYDEDVEKYHYGNFTNSSIRKYYYHNNIKDRDEQVLENEIIEFDVSFDNSIMSLINSKNYILTSEYPNKGKNGPKNCNIYNYTATSEVFFYTILTKFGETNAEYINDLDNELLIIKNPTNTVYLYYNFDYKKVRFGDYQTTLYMTIVNDYIFNYCINSDMIVYYSCSYPTIEEYIINYVENSPGPMYKRFMKLHDSECICEPEEYELRISNYCDFEHNYFDNSDYEFNFNNIVPKVNRMFYIENGSCGVDINDIRNRFDYNIKMNESIELYNNKQFNNVYYFGAGWDNDILNILKTNKFIIVDSLPESAYYSNKNYGYYFTKSKKLFLYTIITKFGDLGMKYDHDNKNNKLTFYNKNNIVEYYYNMTTENYIKNMKITIDNNSALYLSGYEPPINFIKKFHNNGGTLLYGCSSGFDKYITDNGKLIHTSHCECDC
jgi:hypothetical protein